VDVHEVVGTDGRSLGDVGTVKRTLKALSVLWLATIVGVSCGDPSRSSGIEVRSPTVDSIGAVDQFLPLEKVTLIERGRWCATLKVGGVIAYITCTHSDSLPSFAWGDSTRDLLLLIVDSGESISFADGNARTLASSQHWVAAQLRSDMTYDDVQFEITSDEGVRMCALTNQLFMHCTE